MTTDEQARKIAAGLSEAHQRLIKGMYYGRAGWRVDRASRPLERLGLLRGTRVTPRGHAVRKALRDA